MSRWWEARQIHAQSGLLSANAADVPAGAHPVPQGRASAGFTRSAPWGQYPAPSICCTSRAQHSKHPRAAPSICSNRTGQDRGLITSAQSRCSIAEVVLGKLKNRAKTSTTSRQISPGILKGCHTRVSTNLSTDQGYHRCPSGEQRKKGRSCEGYPSFLGRRLCAHPYPECKNHGSSWIL